MHAGLIVVLLTVENQCHTVALNMYYNVSTAFLLLDLRFRNESVLRRYSWNASKENGEEEIVDVFTRVDGALI